MPMISLHARAKREANEYIESKGHLVVHERKEELLVLVLNSEVFEVVAGRLGGRICARSTMNKSGSFQSIK